MTVLLIFLIVCQITTFTLQILHYREHLRERKRKGGDQ